jgi:2-desacetyl-2-hydroxyethyl bacteriochlorophyllide A dehydrogenase
MPRAQAIIFPDQNRVEIGSFDLPDLQPDEMLVRTEFSGVSQGTEIWAFTGMRPEIKYPTVPGYQSVGIVEEVGSDAAKFRPGQRVAFMATRLPSQFAPTWMGGHVSRAVIRDGALVPEGADPAAAALAALPAVSWRGINMLNVRIGDLVVVTGQGLIGQGSAQMARLRGATVIATDISPKRLELSKRFSADIVVNPKEQDLGEVVRSIESGGADVVIETTGRSDQFAPSISLLRWEGQLLLQGYYPDPITFDFHKTHAKKPTIAVTCGHDFGGISVSMELMKQGKLHFRELITDLAPFTSALEVYPRLAAGDPDVLGVVFDWTGA